MADRLRKRTRHDEKDTNYQIKGKTTRKLIANARSGEVDWTEETDRTVKRDRKF